MNELEYMNQMQLTAYSNNEAFAYIGIISIILQIITHLLIAWGLWKINKKLWEPHAWLAWIPVVNIYSYVKAAWKPNIWILWLLLAAIAMIIPIIWIIIFLFVYITIIHSISKRCGKWAWTTVGLFFIPFIMFPVLAYNCEPKKEEKKEENASTNNKQIEL